MNLNWPLIDPRGFKEINCLQTEYPEHTCTLTQITCTIKQFNRVMVSSAGAVHTVNTTWEIMRVVITSLQVGWNDPHSLPGSAYCVHNICQTHKRPQTHIDKLTTRLKVRRPCNLNVILRYNYNNTVFQKSAKFKASITSVNEPSCEKVMHSQWTSVGFRTTVIVLSKENLYLFFKMLWLFFYDHAMGNLFLCQIW